MRPVIDRVSSKFSEVLSNDSEQSIHEHMMKFKGRSEMKQYIKSKPIEWNFKFWFRCSSKSGYLHQMDTYLGRKQTPQFNLGVTNKMLVSPTKCYHQQKCCHQQNDLGVTNKMLSRDSNYIVDVFI